MLLAWSIAQQRCLRRVSWRSPGYVGGLVVVRGHGWEELSTILSSLIEPAFEKVTCSSNFATHYVPLPSPLHFLFPLVSSIDDGIDMGFCKLTRKDLIRFLVRSN